MYKCNNLNCMSFFNKSIKGQIKIIKKTVTKIII